MINERKLSKSELEKREDIIMKMKGNKRDLVKKYGKDAEAVMYGRATNMAKKKTENMRDPKITELIKDALKNPKKVDEDYDGGDLESGAFGDPVDAELDVTTAAPDHTEEEAELGLEEGQFDELKKHQEIMSKAADFFRDKAKELGVDISKIKDFTQGINDLETAIFKADYKKSGGKIDEDIDIGHEDNEPGMLQGDLYQIGKSAMEIYEMLDAMEGDGEVDLPSWWQSKIYKAKEAIVGAAEYLDFELKEPAIDAVVDKVAPLDINVEPSVDIEIDETVEDYITSVDDLTENNMKKSRIAERIAKQIKEGDLFSSRWDRPHLKDIIRDFSPNDKAWVKRAYDFLKSLLDNEDKAELGLTEDKDWIQKAIKRPGALHRALGIPQDKDIPDSLIDKDIRKMDRLEKEEGHLDKKDLRFLRQLDLAKTLEKFNEEEIREALPKGFWDKAMDAKDEDQDGKVDESFDSLAKKIDKQKGKSKKDAANIAGYIANLKRKGAGSGPTAKQKKRMSEDYDSLVSKIKKSGKSDKAAKAIAGAVASYKAKGGGKGPTAKQK